ncbi:MAG: hypothetical protein V4725_00575 [Bacteroidota bacterium]
MMAKIKIPALLIVLSALLFSCAKEYSLEVSKVLPPAEFAFTGAPGTCTNAIIGGTYEAGVALGANNSITLTVDVTAPGSYTVTTGVNNGISFTSSGSFTTTGPQVIVLAGSGTPLSEGDFSYSPGNAGCSFSIMVAPGGGGTGGTGVFTYQGGTANCTGATPTGDYVVGTPLDATNTVTLNVNVTTIGTYTVSTPPLNGITFSASGNFTATGLQTITLTGSGTPTAAGDLIYAPPGGCSFTVTITPPIVLDFLTFTLDGVAKTFNVDLGALSLTPNSFVFGGQESIAANSPFLIITLTNATPIGVGTYEKFSATTNNGTYNVAEYYDGVDPAPWAITTGQGDKFTVVVTEFKATNIKGTFTGSLYSSTGAGTNVKVITNGAFSISY